MSDPASPDAASSDPPPSAPRWRRLRRIALALVGLAALAGLVLWLLVVLVPFPAEWLAPTRVESRRVVDRHGHLLREALSDVEGRGVWMPLDRISPWIPEAFVAIEDRRFHTHGGLDPRGIARALRDNLAAGRVVAGGSTLTQQVVKLARQAAGQGTGRGLWRKAVEALWALRLERAVDKRAILEQYVNRAPFGHGATGVEAAARLYLDKPARALSLGEAALLAGLPRAPSRDNPYVDPDRAEARRRFVLARMRETGAITPAEEAEALAQEVRVVSREVQFAAPHFTTFALARAPAPGTLPTTLDGGLQAEVERLARQVVRALADKRVGQAAAVVLDNASGDVLAWVGSVDFFDPAEGQVDMVIGRRQPGSTLKPFVYGLALERGFTAADRLPDLPLWFPTGLGDYRPRNYDRRFHGWVSLRTALANSYNVPAVWMAHRLGPADLLRRLRRLGFESLTRSADHYGLGLALGNGEVQLLELANAYRALANEGVWSPIRWRRDTPPSRGGRVMPADVARLLTDILADPVARIPAFGRRNSLTLPFPAAAKTGTSTDFTDNWTAGYTPDVTVAVWVGNFDGRPMEGVSGVTGAGRLWHRVMRAAAALRGGRGRFSTAGLVRRRLCADTGQPLPEDTRPGADDCPHAIDELFRPEHAPEAPRRIIERLRVSFPGPGDVFQLDADTPQRYARLQLRAEVPDGLLDDGGLIWAIDDHPPAAAPPQRWWDAAPGEHTIRVWPAGRPDEASPPVRFTVLK